VKSKITDKDFFTSNLFRGYLADMADATGKRYRKPIKIILDWDERDDAHAAYTDNQLIYINAASSITKDLPTRALKTEGLIGVLAHEVGHILFSDFEQLTRFKTAIGRGEFYPRVPVPNSEAEQEALADIMEIVRKPDSAYRKATMELIAFTAFGILNIIEDIYIEARLCHMFPGAYKSGINLINRQIVDNASSLQEQMESGRSPISIITNLILCYARSGDIKNPEGLNNEYTSALYNCIPYIDAAIYSEDAKVRYNGANMVLLNIWSFVKEALKDLEDGAVYVDNGVDSDIDKHTKDVTSGDSTDEYEAGNDTNIIMGIGGGNSGDDDTQSDGYDSANSKNSVPSKNPVLNHANDKALQELLNELLEHLQESFGQVGASPTGTNRPIGAKLGNSGDDGDDVGNDGDGYGVTIGDVSSGDNGGDYTSVADASGDSDSGGGYDDGSDNKNLALQADHIPLEENDDFYTSGDGSTIYNRDYEGSGISSAASDVQRILNTMAREQVGEALESDLRKELQALANEIHYGDVHRGVDVRINRMTHVDDHLVDSYNAVSAPLLSLSKRLQKQVSQILKDRREGGKLTGLLYGKRFSARDAVRNDGRQFYNTRLPSDPMELAVAVLVDESGSMQVKNRVETAKAASIVLYDFCSGLDIPIAIYGHTTSDFKNDVELYAHAEFNSFNNRDKYRLMDISARSCNRDGAALRFTAEHLLKRPEPLKLLILISDGQPHDSYGYHGVVAEADLRSIKQEYTRKGIKLFCAAIGEDKENIERIYKDGFLDITSLDKLPQNLCSLLSGYIKTL